MPPEVTGAHAEAPDPNDPIFGGVTVRLDAGQVELEHIRAHKALDRLAQVERQYAGRLAEIDARLPEKLRAEMAGEIRAKFEPQMTEAMRDAQAASEKAEQQLAYYEPAAALRREFSAAEPPRQAVALQRVASAPPDRVAALAHDAAAERDLVTLAACVEASQGWETTRQTLDAARARDARNAIAAIARSVPLPDAHRVRTLLDETRTAGASALLRWREFRAGRTLAIDRVALAMRARTP